MTDSIIPDPAATEKPEPPVEPREILDDWFEETHRALRAILSLQTYLGDWGQRLGHVPVAEVEAAYAMLRRAHLEEWAQARWAELRDIVTGGSPI